MTNRFSKLETTPIGGGIDMPADDLIDYSTPDQLVTYPPCRKCGKSHGMGVKEMATGKIDPMDICYDCFWVDSYYPIKEQVILND